MGTLLVNVLGSTILGVLLGASLTSRVPDPVMLTVGTGLCGALTTYSTFGYETVRLFEEGAHLHSMVNVLISTLAGLGAAVVGYAAGAAL